MANRRILLVLFLFACTQFSGTLSAQAAWHEVSLRADNERLPLLKAIAIPAEAEYKGKKLKAYVFLYGTEGRGAEGRRGGIGYPTLCIYVENVESIVPAAEIEQFVGPDLPPVAADHNAIELSVEAVGGQKLISSRLIYNGTQYFDTGFKTDGFFETNIRGTKSATDAWKHFLAQIGNGFEGGKAVIGGKAFSSKLTVKFSGNGLGAQLKELLAYCNKQQ